MEKYTNKIRNIYLEMLALDSIYNILSWYDRTSIHRILKGEIVNLEEKPMMLNEYIRMTGWTSPYMKYGQDRLLYFYHENTESDYPIEEYKKMYSHITNDLKYIQNELDRIGR